MSAADRREAAYRRAAEALEALAALVESEPVPELDAEDAAEEVREARSWAQAYTDAAAFWAVA